jgi:anti-anti-sigma factor
MDMAASELAGGITCVRLHGRMDAAGAGRIDLPFTASVVTVGRNAVIDLSEVSFIASMGIRLLISAARGLHVKGARLALFGAQGMVRTVLDEAAIDQVIPLVDTEEQALRALAA